MKVSLNDLITLKLMFGSVYSPLTISVGKIYPFNKILLFYFSTYKLDFSFKFCEVVRTTQIIKNYEFCIIIVIQFCISYVNLLLYIS